MPLASAVAGKASEQERVRRPALPAILHAYGLWAMVDSSTDPNLSKGLLSVKGISLMSCTVAAVKSQY